MAPILDSKEIMVNLIHILQKENQNEIIEILQDAEISLEGDYRKINFDKQIYYYRIKLFLPYEKIPKYTQEMQQIIWKILKQVLDLNHEIEDFICKPKQLRIKHEMEPTVLISNQLKPKPILTQSIPEKTRINEDLVNIFRNFDRIAKCFEERKGNKKSKDKSEPRESIVIEDEMDVQFILKPLLYLYFDTVKPEEPISTLANNHYKIDFYLPNEKIGIECKLVKTPKDSKLIIGQINDDIAGYGKNPDIRELYIFIYNPNRKIANIENYIKEIESIPSNFDNLKVFINP